MDVFESPDPDAEVRGAAVESILTGVPGTFEPRAEAILSENGIESLSETEWYLLQSYLDAYETIVADIGEVTLQQIGRTTPETAEWPPGVETPFDALVSIDDAYQLNHRGDVGGYEATRSGPTAAAVTTHTPYPCAYEHALVEATAEQFADGPAEATTERAEGADCVFRVEW